jgi:hypothetical protein
MIQTILIILISIIILFYIYIRLKHRFWCIQPVFHIYDIHYWFRNGGIIRKELPEKNRYTNFKDISFFTFNKINDKQLKEFIFLIQNNYLKNKENHFHPKKENIIPYFKNHFADCYFTFYYKDILLEDIKSLDIIPDKKLIGVITSRPLHVIIQNKLLDVYYVDYLCVDKSYRKKNIAPELIQTHEYLQSHNNKKIGISIFKREDNLTGIIPICVYKTYCFNMQNWYNPLNNINLLKGDGNNIYYLYNFINENKKKWDIQVLCELSNLIELIRSNNIHIYMIILEKEIKAAYFYRKVCTSITKGKEVVSCFASIKGEIEEENFIQGFKIGLSKIVKKHNFSYLCVEDISDNNIIIKNLLIKNNPTSIHPTAYFFYNFAYQTFSSNKVLMIN